MRKMEGNWLSGFEPTWELGTEVGIRGFEPRPEVQYL